MVNDHRKSAKRLKGEVKERLGAVTGDRRVEAAGEIEQQVADPQAPVKEKNEETVDRQEESVRRAHHDI